MPPFWTIGRLVSSAQGGEALTDFRIAEGISAETAFGRCGPGTRWPVLGDVYTADCVSHDYAGRLAKLTGSSDAMAHIKALPHLPAAIGSYVKAKVI